MRIDKPVRNSFCNNDLNRYLYSEHNTGLETGRDRYSSFAVPAGKLNEALSRAVTMPTYSDKKSHRGWERNAAQTYICRYCAAAIYAGRAGVKYNSLWWPRMRLITSTLVP